MTLEKGSRVRYTPVIGGEHDGRIYTVRDIGKIPSIRTTVVWLAGKAGAVGINAVYPIPEEDYNPIKATESVKFRFADRGSALLGPKPPNIILNVEISYECEDDRSDEYLKASHDSALREALREALTAYFGQTIVDFT